MTKANQLFILIAIALLALLGCIGFAGTTVAGMKLPVAVESLLGKVFPSKREEGKDVSELHETIPEVQVPCGFIIGTSLYEKDPSQLDRADVFPVETVLDLSQVHSTISKDVVMRDRYLKILYEEAGDRKVIPEESLWLRMGSLEATMPSPLFRVVDDRAGSRYKVRLGRDFLEMNSGKVDLDEMEMFVAIKGGKRVMIPFLQTRSSLGVIGSEEL